LVLEDELNVVMHEDNLRQRINWRGVGYHS
jgi:hypothetical protein